MGVGFIGVYGVRGLGLQRGIWGYFDADTTLMHVDDQKL